MRTGQRTAGEVGSADPTIVRPSIDDDEPAPPNISRDAGPQPGKHLLLKVPNFNLASNQADAMTTYLRLGAIEDPAWVAAPLAPKDTGEDLAAKVTTFVDDTRFRDGCPDFVPVEQRLLETAKLHTKGGVRDHTDGNRITTTRGDKVEVIQGNYRLVVLGRGNDSAGEDISGGHVSQGGITFSGGGGVEYTTQYYGGTWKVVESTWKGDVITSYHGLVKDFYSGEDIQTQVGSESPTTNLPNPVITNRTWAERIASYTGSSAYRVPEIISETHADSISSLTDAESIEDVTEVTGSISSTTAGASVWDTTTAGIIASTTVGNVIDTTVGTSLSTILGAETEVIVGNVAEVTMGAETSLSLGAMLDFTLALMLEVCIAGKLDVSVGPTILVDMTEKFEIKPLGQDSGADELRLFGIKTGITGVHTDTAGFHFLG